MAEDHPGAGFNFQVAQTVFLRPGKIKDLLLGEFNIANILTT